MNSTKAIHIIMKVMAIYQLRILLILNTHTLYIVTKPR